MKRAIGTRGSWFAEVDGERLPCTHAHWIKGKPPVHSDPNAIASDPKWIELVDALKETGKTIVTKDRVLPENQGFEREGYVAIFSISNVRLEEGALKFNIVERLEDLQ